jgi:hypothetical protein
MPFDGLPEGLVSDLVKLRIALDGVRSGWTDGRIGLKDAAEHCAIGWLLVATDWDRDEATRLALEYVYPALPEKARNGLGARLASIYRYNDQGSQRRIVRLFAAACQLAEQPAVR